MIEILILYVLNRHDLTIYKLERAIKELFSPFLKPSLGSIAPLLNKLAENKFVTFSEKFSQGGLKSKTYSITPSGLTQLKKLIVDFKFKNLHSVQKNTSALLFCLDILDDADKEVLFKKLENNLKVFKIEVEKEIQSPYIRLEDFQRQILETQIKEIEALLDLIEKFKKSDILL